MSELVLTRSEKLVPATPRTRAVARGLALSTALFLLAAVLLPWQQSIDADGRVLSLAPSDRKQAIESPVTGRVVRWLVRDGAEVQEGDPLVEIGDNDPRLIERMYEERAAVLSKLASYRARVGLLAEQRASLERARTSEVRAAEAKLRAQQQKLNSQKQKVEATSAALETAMLQLGRVRALTERGLSAVRDSELAELAATKARTERDGAEADLLVALGELDAARAALDEARAEGDAKLQETGGKLSSGESDVADAQVSLARLEVAIARQERQLVRAPRRGTVVEILTTGTGVQVKQGDVLASLMPSGEERAVELFLDGSDAAIVEEGRHVRLQFEGFPALQFSGWPAAALGTFGGTVQFIAPHADGEGRFRVVVAPAVGSERWPPPRYLRQGLRARGWVLLDQVKLGYELWRRMNDFPPALKHAPSADHDAEKGKSS